MFCGNNPVNFRDPWGYAYIAERPVQSWVGRTAAPFVGEGYPPTHYQIFFEDNQLPSNLGLFSDDTVRPDDPNLLGQYDTLVKGLDDALTREAVRSAAEKYGTDWRATDNCQDFVDKVFREYVQMKKQQSKPTQTEGLSAPEPPSVFPPRPEYDKK